MKSKMLLNNGLVVLIVLLYFPFTSCKQIPDQEAASDKYRLVWNTDPQTSVTLAWNQQNSDVAEVFYDSVDFGRKYWKYKQKITPTTQNSKYGMNTYFTLLENLSPGTNYFFVIKDKVGVSKRYWFKTAPSKPDAFTFIAGGDTKSEGLPLEAGRSSNQIVGKLRPLFVLFNGDFTSGNGTDSVNWQKWLDDWFELTTTTDNRLIPLFPVHGNHENGDKGNLHHIFNSPFHKNDSSQIYYSVNVGGSLLHLMALNTEIETGREQQNWIEKDLSDHEDYTFKIAAFHKPFRPHTSSKKENEDLYHKWVWIFDKYGLDVGIDADSHMHKITYPVKPDSLSDQVNMGFVRDDANGTMYIGEGSWGATPRENDDDKPWTLASGSFNQIKWIHVLPKELNNPAHLKIYTVITATYDSLGKQTTYSLGESLTEENLFSVPDGLNVFQNEKFGNHVIFPYSVKN